MLLPVDVLGLVFCFLRAKHVARLSLVCKHFYATCYAASAFWQHQYLQVHAKNEKHVQQVVKKFSMVPNVHIFAPKHQNFCVPLFDKLQGIMLTKAECGIPLVEKNAAILQELHMERVRQVPFSLQTLLMLRKLSLIELGNDLLQQIIPELKPLLENQLDAFELVGLENNTQVFAPITYEWFLNDLKLMWQWSNSSTLIPNILVHCKKLEYLKVRNMIYSQKLSFWSRKGTLRRVVIGSTQQLPLHIIKPSVLHAKRRPFSATSIDTSKLTKLYLYYLSTSVDLCAVATFPVLKHLEMAGEIFTISKPVNSSASITSIKLVNGTALEKEIIAMFAILFPHVKYFEANRQFMYTLMALSTWPNLQYACLSITASIPATCTIPIFNLPNCVTITCITSSPIEIATLHILFPQIIPISSLRSNVGRNIAYKYKNRFMLQELEYQQYLDALSYLCLQLAISRIHQPTTSMQQLVQSYAVNTGCVTNGLANDIWKTALSKFHALRFGDTFYL